MQICNANNMITTLFLTAILGLDWRARGFNHAVLQPPTTQTEVEDAEFYYSTSGLERWKDRCPHEFHATYLNLWVALNRMGYIRMCSSHSSSPFDLNAPNSVFAFVRYEVSQLTATECVQYKCREFLPGWSASLTGNIYYESIASRNMLG